uniref:Uncharacterized protein n=1 Tax=Plectus sambesii TaxID=2011161 RepID=A0A914VGT8_9BILA
MTRRERLARPYSGKHRTVLAFGWSIGAPKRGALIHCVGHCVHIAHDRDPPTTSVSGMGWSPGLFVRVMHAGGRPDVVLSWPWPPELSPPEPPPPPPPLPLRNNDSFDCLLFGDDGSTQRKKPNCSANGLRRARRQETRLAV